MFLSSELKVEFFASKASKLERKVELIFYSHFHVRDKTDKTPSAEPISRCLGGYYCFLRDKEVLLHLKERVDEADARSAFQLLFL